VEVSSTTRAAGTSICITAGLELRSTAFVVATAPLTENDAFAKEFADADAANDELPDGVIFRKRSERVGEIEPVIADLMGTVSTERTFGVEITGTELLAEGRISPEAWDGMFALGRGATVTGRPNFDRSRRGQVR